MLKLSSVLLTILLICMLQPSAYAQVTTATLGGTVLDPSGARVAAAKIRLTSTETGLSRETQSDEDGRYVFTELPVGGYQVSAEAQGFATTVQRGIVLVVGQVATLDLKLVLGQAKQEIQVSGEAPIVDVVSPTIAGVIGEDEVRTLPLNVRSFTNLATLQPGIIAFPYPVSNTATSAQNHQGSLITSNGMPPGAVTFLMDGVDMADSTNRGSPGTAAGDLLGVDAIREFSILTHNYDAEYGKSAGAIINYVTKSGSNSLHGSVYEFLRNSAFDARNFFDPAGEVPPFKRNQFGVSLGGPIKKNKTFFFGNYEGYRQRLTTTQIAIVPDENARQGPVNPAVVPYLNLYPHANGPDIGGGLALASFGNYQPVNQNYFAIRLDHQLTTNDSFMVRYTYTGADTKQSLSVPAFESVNNNRNQYLTLQETRVISNRTVNVANFGFNRSRLNVDYQPTVNIDPSLFFFPERNKFGIISFGAGGSAFNTGAQNQLSALGADARSPLSMASEVYAIEDKVSHTVGSHTLKIGGQIRWYRLNWNAQAYHAGAYSFTGLQDFLAGTPLIYSVCPAFCVDGRGYRTTAFAWFVNDNWRVNDKLTVTVGLRHEFNTIPTEVHGRIANLDPAQDTAFRVGTTDNVLPLAPLKKAPIFSENGTLKQFEPRVGLAYQPFGPKTVVRSGFGIYHNFASLAELVNQISANVPFNDIALSFFPPFPYDPAANITTTPGAAILANIGHESLTAYQWNLTLEHSLTDKMQVHVTYVGSHSSHGGRIYEANTKIPQILPNGQEFFPPGFAPGRLTQWTPGTLVISAVKDVNSNYHALQVGTLRRFNRGFQLQADYVWSKAVTPFEDTFNVTWASNLPPQTMDPNHPERDKGLSGLNPAHRLTFSYTYELPIGRGHLAGGSSTGAVDKLISGWSITGINSVSTGFPMSPLVGFDQANQGNFGFPSDRPDLVPGASKNPVLGGANEYFDVNAFALPAAGFFGNLGRNTVIGPGIVSLDISLIKSTVIKEDKKLEFRAEFFNFPNHTNLGAPNMVLFLPDGSRNTTAGKIFNTVTTSRQIQFGLKFLF